MRRKWIIPVAAAALALVTTLAVIGYLQSLQQRVAVVPPLKTEAVVVAKANIPERKVVSVDFLELRQLPATAIHPLAARRLEEVTNRVAVAPMFAGEQVLMNKLAPAGITVGLSYVLPKDKRAMTIAVNEVIGVAGFVFPGDRVDVVGTVTLNDKSLTKIVLQDVEVMAIAQKVEQKPGEDPRVTTSATLALAPEQAEVLAQVDNNGKVRLALRPYGSTDRVQTAGMSIEAALGRQPAQPAAPAKGVSSGAASTSRPARKATAITPAARPAAPAVAAASVYSVELWRATEKTTVRFEEGRK